MESNCGKFGDGIEHMNNLFLGFVFVDRLVVVVESDNNGLMEENCILFGNTMSVPAEKV